MKKKPALGRGLNALLQSAQAPQEVRVDALDDKVNATHQDGELRHLPIEWLQPGQYQPRKDIQPEALEELAASIKAQGLMQPLVVRPLAAENRYEIIAGERRWRACQIAQYERVPVLIREVSDESALAMALIENLQREDLNPMEEAIALHRLQQEFELTQQEVADAVGKNRATVANLLRLMNLNEDVKRLLEHGDIEMGHARALLGLTGNVQSDAASEVVARTLTVRQTEALVRLWQQGKLTKAEAPRPNPDVLRLEKVLGDRLGATVAIQHNAKGKGKLVINYSSLDELDGILAHIK